MKTLKNFALFSALAFAIILAGCSEDDDANVVPYKKNLNNAEKAGLFELAQVEQLHNDIYAEMNITYPCDLFEELCACDGDFAQELSELIEEYRLENPNDGRTRGHYENENVQNTFNEYLVISTETLSILLEFAQTMEKQAQKLLTEQINLVEGNEDVIELYEKILEESKCQAEAIKNKLDGQENSVLPDVP